MQPIKFQEVSWRNNIYRFVVSDENDEIQLNYVVGNIYEQEELDFSSRQTDEGRTWWM